jgi:hypothetical protein
MENEGTVSMLNQVLGLWGGVLLHPTVITSGSAHDRHPERLLRDLVSFYDQIFTDTDPSLSVHMDQVSLVPSDGETGDEVGQFMQVRLNSPQPVKKDIFQPVPISTPFSLHQSVSTIEVKREEITPVAIFTDPLPSGWNDNKKQDDDGTSSDHHSVVSISLNTDTDPSIGKGKALATNQVTASKDSDMDQILSPNAPLTDIAL